MKQTLRLAALLSLAVYGFAGQKQELVIANPLQAVTDVPTTGQLDEAELKLLVEKVFNKPENDRAYLVHVMKYLPTKLSPSVQNWYVWDPAERNRKLNAFELGGRTVYKDPRVFGRKKLGLVYLHIVDAVSREDVARQVRSHPRVAGVQTEKPSAKTTDDELRKEIRARAQQLKTSSPSHPLVTSITEAFVTTANRGQLESSWGEVRHELVLEGLLSSGTSTGVIGQVRLVDENSRNLKPWGDLWVIGGAEQLATLSYGVSIESKEPAPYANLKTIAGFAAGAMAAGEKIELRVRPTPTAMAAGATFETPHVPSDIAVAASYTAGDKVNDIGKLIYDNEGRYWYDFSLALPLATTDELRYDQTATALTASTIKKANLYGAFNFGLKRDTKKTQLFLIPSLLYGIPISGQPLKHHLFAASVGVKYASFFVGVRLDQKNFVRDYSQPLTGDNVFRAWRTHMAYGLNFPVGPIVQALTKKK